MADIGVITAVTNRLTANFAAAPVFAENGEQSVPADLTSFVMLQFPFNTTGQASAGSPGQNFWREEGAFRVVINVPRGSGAATGRQWAKEIRDLFRGQRFDGVRTFAPTSPVSDDRNDESAYYKLTFAVPYQFDIRG